MNILYCDAVGGVSGDMLAAALLDAAPEGEEFLVNSLKRLDLNPWQWQSREDSKGSFRARKIDFVIEEGHSHRHLPDIVSIIKNANFPQGAEDRILAAFDVMADAESKAHGIDREQVHFHEVGADDSILDIAAVCLLLEYLQIDGIYSSPLPMGGGVSLGCHGLMPHPAPALNYLLEGVAVVGIGEEAETVTPTGLALLKANKTKFGPIPSMTITKIGCGCGTRDTKRPNILRCFLGMATDNATNSEIFQLEATVDDMTGEDVGALWDKIFTAGATDMHLTPVQMKKGRPGQKITVLTQAENLDEVRRCLFLYTTTIGMTCRSLGRFVLNRSIEPITTPIGEIDVKIARGYGVTKAKAEFQQLEAAAREHGITLSQARNIVAAEIHKKGRDQ